MLRFLNIVIICLLLVLTKPSYGNEEPCGESKELEQYPEQPDQPEQKYPKIEFYVKTDKIGIDTKPKDKKCHFKISFDKFGDQRVWIEATTINTLSGAKPKKIEKSKCWVEFSDYVETLPGIKEPKTAIFFAYAKIGAFQNRDYGEVWCTSEAYYTYIH